MCLAIPGRIVRVEPGPAGDRVAEVDYGSTRRSAHLLYLPEVGVGDYVVVQAGFAIRRVTEAEARESWAAAAEAAEAVPP